MAKKPRTPAPPKRPVQAPQKRDPRRARAAAKTGTDRRRLWTIVAVLALIAIAAIAAALYFALRGNGSTSSSNKSAGGFEMRVDPAKDAQYNRLPGVRKTKAPWPPDFAHLDERLAPLGLTSLSQEALAYHIHQHLDIYVNGKHLNVPECVGIFGCYKHFVYLTELHTHSTDGVIHNESPTTHNYSLGDFFAEWGVFLNKRCVGGYCQGYKWYVNGKLQHGNPQDLVLTPHLEIVFVIGKPPKKIPSTYNWKGL
jgi:hypothetical protein